MPRVPTADGCRLQAEIEGNGEAVMLISGLSGRADFWNPVRPRLARRYRVITFDQRGLGSSERSAAPCTIGLMASDVLAVLDHFGVDRAHIVGHSTGGTVAQTLAIDHPSRVGRLVLSGTWARPDYRFRLLFNTRLSVLQRAGPEAYHALGQLLTYPPSWINVNEAAISAKLTAADGMANEPIDIVAERISMLLAFDRLADLRKIATRTLVISAVDDAMVPFSHAQQLAREISGARLMETEGGHFFPSIEPESFASAVEEFLGQA
ncbi:MAG: alpha/beta fold hydrolase [Hyphomicrobiaceae bacterium]